MGQAQSRVVFLVPEPATCTLTLDRVQKFTFRGSDPKIVPREVADMARHINREATSPQFYVEDLNGQIEGSVMQPEKRGVKKPSTKAKKKTKTGADPNQPDVLDSLPKRHHKVLDGAHAQNG